MESRRMESRECDTDLWLVHSEEGEANSDLSGEEGSTQSDDESGLAGDSRQLVVEPRHLILLLVAIETVYLYREREREESYICSTFELVLINSGQPQNLS